MWKTLGTQGFTTAYPLVSPNMVGLEIHKWNEGLNEKTVIKCYLVGGFNPTPLKNMKVYEFVSWDDDIPKLNGK